MRNKITLANFLLVILIVAITLSGCKSKKQVELDPQKLGSDKEIYEKARKRMKRDSAKSRLLFKEIMHLYPDSIYARRSKIGIADSYFKQKDSASLIMAATEYQEYVNLYPHSPDAVYAKFQIAMCYYKQIKKPGRDQSNTHLALKALENMIKQYPGTNEAKDAKTKLAEARARLGKHYFAIGVSNYNLKAFRGAQVRFKQVMDEYPEFKDKAKLFYLTGKCYYYMRDIDSSLSFFHRIVNSYPKSKYLKKSTAMIDTITQLKKRLDKAKLRAKVPAKKTADKK